MRLLKVHSVRLLIAALSLLLVSSCREATSEKIVHLWIFNNTSNPLSDMKKILKNFHLENPGINVDVTILDWGSGFSKIMLAAATRNGPDVIQVPSTWAASLTEAGSLMPLDSIALLWGDSDLFIAGARESMQPKNSVNITSLPWFLDVRPFYYRKDVMDKLEINPDTISTRSSFADVLRHIKNSKTQINNRIVDPMGYPAKNDWNIVHNFASWIFSAGGSFLTEDLSKSNLLNEHTLDGIYFYLDFVKNGYNNYSSLDKTTAGVSVDFDQGKTAFIGETTSKLLYLENQNFLQGTNSSSIVPYGCIMPPTAKEIKHGKYFLGGSNLGIFNSTKVKRESMALLRYLTTQSDTQFQFARISGFLPALTETYRVPYFSNNKNRSVFQKIVENAVSYPSVSYWSAIETDVLTKRFGNIFSIIANSEGKSWPKEQIDAELKAADKEMNAIISRDIQNRKGNKVL
ncbi:MAG: extracellular solute-binding protein [Fibromonadaceae bacterium]|jgi:multiple sugar transport system substrate-binding protein|nr:extracellular solute-binding protein [Fibromonadaceae bacterium]